MFEKFDEALLEEACSEEPVVAPDVDLQAVFREEDVAEAFERGKREGVLEGARCSQDSRISVLMEALLREIDSQGDVLERRMESHLQEISDVFIRTLLECFSERNKALKRAALDRIREVIRRDLKQEAAISVYLSKSDFGDWHQYFLNESGDRVCVREDDALSSGQFRVDWAHGTLRLDEFSDFILRECSQILECS